MGRDCEVIEALPAVAQRVYKGRSVKRDWVLEFDIAKERGELG